MKMSFSSPRIFNQRFYNQSRRIRKRAQRDNSKGLLDVRDTWRCSGIYLRLATINPTTSQYKI